MRVLETTFTKYGHLFTQIAREENKALYERTSNGRHICYELIRIRQAEASLFQGKELPARELYPSNEEFGYYAWSLTYHTLDKALARYKSLTVPIKSQKSNYPHNEDAISNQTLISA